MSAEPYYADELVTLFHGDALRFLLDAPEELSEAVIVTDPPYGISYSSGATRREGFARSIRGDRTTALRDFLVCWLADDQPALIFGSPRIPKPSGIKGTLIWDKGGALGMGDLALPWKFDHEEIYVRPPLDDLLETPQRHRGLVRAVRHRPEALRRMGRSGARARGRSTQGRHRGPRRLPRLRRARDAARPEQPSTHRPL